MRVFLWSLCFGLASVALGLDLPPVLVDFLRERPDLVRAFGEIPQVSPQEFIQNYRSEGRHKQIGQGFTSVLFVDSSGRRVTKFSFAIHASQGLFEPLSQFVSLNPDFLQRARDAWADLFRLPGFLAQEKKRFGRGELVVAVEGLTMNILASLVWMQFSPRPLPKFLLLSRDGLAYQMEAVDGPSLAEVLIAQRQSKVPSRFKYNMDKVWKELVFWQKVNEKMLLAVGVATDLFNPGNFVVRGTLNDPELVPIDYNLVLPSQEVREYYSNRQIRMQVSPQLKRLAAFAFPTFPEQIVTNRLWDLSMEQALDYIKAFHADGDSGFDGALDTLALVPVFKNHRSPSLVNDALVVQAREACAKKLATPGNGFNPGIVLRRR